MSIEISKELKDAMIGGGIQDKNSPFYSEAGAYYVRFDAFRQRNTVVHGEAMLETVFLWRGEETLSQFTRGIQFQHGNVFEFICIEGRIKVELTT